MAAYINFQRRSSMDKPLSFASRHDATLLDEGPPVLYRLNTEKKYIDGTNRKVRQWTYGRRDRNKQNKVILMVGETGAGKTTIINTMINDLLEVKFEDQEFYQITEETDNKDQSQSQTSTVTVYEVFVEENPTSLTIIDTPGYAHTEGYEKDREISEYLMRLFSDEDGIHYIDAVCFVMKASQNRLSGKEHYIFHSVLSLFGKDIKNNIVFLLTYSDGGPPTDAFNAINKAEIPCRRDGKGQPVHFLFNNRQKAERDKEYEHAYRSSWEMGERSMKKFFTLLEENNRKSVVMTLDVLKERRRLEACVDNLVERISEKEQKTEELTQIQEALRQNRDKIDKCENFQFTVSKTVKEKVSSEDEWWWKRNRTCCSDCEENCHESCWWAEDPSNCWVMKDEHCTVCSKKCHYSKHVREKKKYVTKRKDVTMTFDKLKQEYEGKGKTTVTSFDKTKYENTKKQLESNVKESENKTAIEQNLKSDLEEVNIEKSRLLEEAYVTIMRLSEIALKADSAFTLQHLDFLIPRLKEEKRDEWTKNLEDLSKAGEEQKNKGALCHVMDFNGQKLKRFDSRVTAAMASSTHHRRRKSLDEPPEIIAGVIRTRDEFIELYERDYLELQQCTERLHCIIEEFEEVYRRSAKDSRGAGWVRIGGVAALFAALVAAPFTLETSLLAVVGFTTVLALRVRMSISNKKQQMTQLRQGIEAELKEFQDKIKPMTEKMNDIINLTEKILKEQDVIRIEDVFELTAQMSANMQSTASLGAVVNFGLKDMDKLAETPIDEEIDESEMTSKDGKFIVRMKKFIHQLQNIIDKLQRAKDKIVIY